MRGLPKVLPQFPRSVLEKKILPGLVEELRDGSMLALVLPNVFAIAEAGSARLFSEKVLHKLKEVFLPPGGTSAPSTEPKTAAAKIAEREKEAGREGGLTVVISSLPIIMEKTTSREFKEDILPIYQLALESPTHALQDLALRSLVVILPKLDFPTLKNDLFPVVASVFTKTSSLGIKIRGLEAFKVLCGGTPPVNTDGLEGFNKIEKQRAGDCPVLDKYTIQEKVVPLLKGIKTKEPAVMMAALEVFSEIGKICDREIVAMELLPGLWTMSFGPLLGLEQVCISTLPISVFEWSFPVLTHSYSSKHSWPQSNPSPQRSNKSKPANSKNSPPLAPATPATARVNSYHSAASPAPTPAPPAVTVTPSQTSSSARASPVMAPVAPAGAAPAAATMILARAWARRHKRSRRRHRSAGPRPAAQHIVRRPACDHSGPPHQTHDSRH